MAALKPDSDGGHDLGTSSLRWGTLHVQDLNIPAGQSDTTFGSNVVVTGNLTVNGTTTTISTSNLNVEDAILHLQAELGDGVANATDMGFIMERGSTGDNAAIIWDESSDTFLLGTTAETGADTDVTVAVGSVQVGKLEIDSSAAHIDVLGGTLTATNDAAIEIASGGTSDIVLDSAGDVVIDGVSAKLEFGSAASGEHITGDGTDLTIASGEKINLTATTDVHIPANVGLVFDANASEKIESNDTDLTITSGADINLTATADVNVPSGVGLTFGDDGEKIEGDGADLTISSSNKLNLTATTDVHVPANVGLVFGDGEKIEGDDTDLTVTSGGKINLTATSDVVIPSGVGLVLDGTGAEKIESDGTDISISVGAGGDINIPSAIGLTFGDDGEKIEGDGTDLTIASGAKLNLNATSDVHLPANVGLVFDANASEKIESNDTDLTITSGADINLTATADVNLPANVGLTFGDDGEKIEGDGDDLTISSSGVLNLSTSDVKLTSSGAKLTIGNAQEADTMLLFDGNINNFHVSLEDFSDSLVIGSGSTAGTNANLTLDASNNVTVGNNLTITGTSIDVDAASALTIGSSVGANNLTLGAGSSTVVVPGNLTVNGATTTVSTTNLDVEDAIIMLQAELSGAANATDMGFIMERGTSGNNAAIIWDEDNTKFLLGTTAETGADSDVTVAVGPVQVGKLEIDGAANHIDIVSSNLKLTAAADIDLGAASNVNIASGIGLTFGDDGEKISGDGTDLTIASGAKINLTATSDVHVPANVGLVFGDGEKIEGDDTDLTVTSGGKINLTATSDVHVPANVGLVFGDGEKIEGDDTDLTVTSGGKINLTATTDVVIPAGVGLVLDGTGAEKIESDGTDITFSVGVGGDINIPEEIGLTFGNDGEKIEGDGTDLTISGNNINLTAVADVVIPANVGVLFGTGEKIEGDNTNLTLTSGADINLTAASAVVVPSGVPLEFVTDSGESISGDGTDLTIASGAKINLTATSDIHVPANVGLVFGDGEKIEGDNTDLTLTSGGDIVLDVTGEQVILKDGSANVGHFDLSGDNLTIKSLVSDKDIVFQGNDGGAGITALTLDMSAAGAASFNDNVTVGGSLLIPDGGAIGSASDADALQISAGGQVHLTGTTAGTTATNGILRVDGGTSIAGESFFGGVVNYDGANADIKLKNGGAPNLTLSSATGNITSKGQLNLSDANEDHTISGTLTVSKAVSADANLTIGGKVILGSPTELTISSGAITVTKSYHKVDTEGNASTDGLGVINGGVAGMTLILQAQDSGRTVIMSTGGNIKLAGDASFNLDHEDDTIQLIYDGNNWCEISRSDNS
jgi:hypothetical protein